MSSVEHRTRIRSIFVILVCDKFKIVRENKTIVNLKKENHVRAYAETTKALNYDDDDDGPNIQYKDFENQSHFFPISLQLKRPMSKYNFLI